MRSHSCSMASLAVVLVLCSLSASAQQFIPLGDLAGGDFRSVAIGVSGDGTTAVGYSSSLNGKFEAYRWTASDGMIGLGDFLFGAFESIAVKASFDGGVLVGRGRTFNGDQAFRWTSSDRMVGLGDLPGGSVFSNAINISSDGETIVGGSSSINTSGLDVEAFRWTEASGMVGLGDLPGGGFFSEARAVSADGSVVVGLSRSENTGPEDHLAEAFRWTENDSMTGLGDLEGGIFFSTAFDVSEDGSVVVGVGASENGLEPFRWTENGGMVGLGDFDGGAFAGEAFATSADGSVVVGWSESSIGSEAFRWTEKHGLQSVSELLTSSGISVSGWHLIEVQDISADGKVMVGTGNNPSGNIEGWMAIVPEPATGITGSWAIALLIVTARYRHRQQRKKQATTLRAGEYIVVFRAACSGVKK